ncbi:unnamed protein product [Arabis nemorensis]|uniref:pyruvate dehydrogenase (acetyl-transferring) n=1 Tax=Arabis nemorensis TaxID=586526 RepID=A0A565AMJ4_9BRAS|nr:unnamed protein product [Arabis nemorensis]
MDRDPHVCVMGEDVGHYGGSYKVTKGLADKFGDLRVLDTPICENAFIGAAMTGLRPVIEVHPWDPDGCLLDSLQRQRFDESRENPVILFEHVLLYNLKETIPEEEYICNLEEAEMVRPREHITILTYSRMRYHVMQAAKTLVNKGYDPEVIDN